MILKYDASLPLPHTEEDLQDKKQRQLQQRCLLSRMLGVARQRNFGVKKIEPLNWQRFRFEMIFRGNKLF